MDISKNTLKKIVSYCEENVWEYEDRLEMALSKMDYFRCPLRIADQDLYNDIYNSVEDYCKDYDLDFDNMDIDIEELIFVN